jgi:hypothetical protein
MRSGGSLLAMLVAVGVIWTGTTSAQTNPPTYVLQGDHVAGGLRLGRGTVNQAIAKFGTPMRKRAQGQSRRVTWPQLGLTIDFVSFEGQPCTKGVAVVVTITSRSRWRTALGLRVGDTVARLKTLFPNAARRSGLGSQSGFWLVTRRACAEVGGQPYPGLLARTRNGRVSALVATAGVCE